MAGSESSFASHSGVDVTWGVAHRPLLDDQVVRAVASALVHGGRPGLAVSVALVDDSTLAELHGRFLGDPSPTDVMSFDLGEDGGGPAGEIYVSVDRAELVAHRRGVPVARELALYLVHGALHLCGMDDHEPDERACMRVAERDVLSALGYGDDVGPHDEDPREDATGRD